MNIETLKKNLPNLTPDEKLEHLKKIDLTKLNESQEKNFKEILLSLPEDIIIKYLTYITDDVYVYENNSEENIIVENFLSDELFLSYFNTMIDNIPKELDLINSKYTTPC